ncbi:MAG: hypothetical protein RR505_15430 [Raoultibacter sp.]
MEFGSIPGTFALEDQGQMGESRIATEAEAFRALPVTDEQLQQTDTILDFLHTSGLNRNEQVKDERLSMVYEQLDRQKPLVVFAGQNDFDSGIVPYDKRARKYHMPIFADSLEAAHYLEDLSQQEGWNFIFKPHPFMRRVITEDTPMNWIAQCNFNELIDSADVVVTGVSQSSYIALIRGKPCVTIGYNQLRGKGCTWETNQLEQIAPAIRDALREGFTAEQQEAFRVHVTQLLRYALFDDCSERSLRYGQPPKQAVKLFAQEMAD